MDSNTMCMVTNRSASMVVYSIPEENIRREFQPGETKKIKAVELEKLSYQSGGTALIGHYLLIHTPEVIEDLGIPTEPEYFMTEKEVVELIKNGSLDAWLDCLDFAPEGVIEMIKRLSVDVPLNDMEKRKALKEKTGFNVDAAIRHVEEERAEDADMDKPVVGQPQRRVQTQTAEAASPARRTTPKYNVVKKG